MAIGKVLKEARQRKKWTLRDLERETEISNGYLSLLESDSIKAPSPKHLHQLADSLGVSYNLLMELAGYVPPTISASTDSRVTGMTDLTDTELDQVRAFVGFLKSARTPNSG